jgi:hypothetical protein
MHYSSNCGCGCNYDCGCNTVPSTCSSTTNNIVTTTTHCVGEPCDELYNADCVLYKGPNIPCYGLNVNDTLTDIIDSIVSNFTGCITTDVCFTIITDGIRTVQSCLIKASTDYWNGKQYYKIKINKCSDLIGYVYWNSTDKQWEYSPYLGGGSVMTSILPILSASPLSSTQWININSSIGIISSVSGICTPTTTTSTSTTTTSTTTSTTTTSTTTSTTTTSTTTTRPPTTTSTTSTTTTRTPTTTTSTTTTIAPTTTTTTTRTPTTTTSTTSTTTSTTSTTTSTTTTIFCGDCYTYLVSLNAPITGVKVSYINCAGNVKNSIIYFAGDTIPCLRNGTLTVSTPNGLTYLTKSALTCGNSCNNSNNCYCLRVIVNKSQTSTITTPYFGYAYDVCNSNSNVQDGTLNSYIDLTCIKAGSLVVRPYAPATLADFDISWYRPFNGSTDPCSQFECKY